MLQVTGVVIVIVDAICDVVDCVLVVFICGIVICAVHGVIVVRGSCFCWLFSFKLLASAVVCSVGSSINISDGC